MEVIQAIVGRKVRTVEEGGDLTKGKEYEVAHRAKVTLNDRKVTLAALSNGDHVEIGGGTKDGFTVITAVRDTSKPPIVRTKADLGAPREVEKLDDPNVPTGGKDIWVTPGTTPGEVDVFGRTKAPDAKAEVETLPVHDTGTRTVTEDPTSATETTDADEDDDDTAKKHRSHRRKH